MYQSRERNRIRNRLVHHIASNHQSAAKWMLGNVDHCNYVTANNVTPLNAAVNVGSTSMCNALIASGKVHAPKGIQPALILALSQQKTAIALLLLRRGCNPRIRDIHGVPAIFYAAANHKVLSHVFDAIAKADSKPVRDLNQHMSTCLHVAALIGQASLCRKMCTRNSQFEGIWHVSNLKGQNALMLACHKNHHLCAVELSKVIPLEKEDNAGRCALSYCVMGRHWGLLDWMLTLPEFNRCSHREHIKGNCLAESVKTGSWLLTTHLAGEIRGLSQWRNSQSRCSLLHYLAAYGTPLVSKPLILRLEAELGTDLQGPDITDISGNTPLMYAVKSYNSHMTEVLLSTFKADKCKANSRGETPQSVAERMGVSI